jgi:hypothetical protein
VIPAAVIIRGLDLIVPLLLISLEICLNLLAIGTALNGLVLLFLFLVPVLILSLIFWWPALMIVLCLLNCTSVRMYTKRQVSTFFAWMLYKYQGRQRKTSWNVLYSLISFSLPSNIVAQNCGFAMVTATGESLQQELREPLTEREAENLF